MVHWTDKAINWQSLNAREIRNLINTWGTDTPKKKAVKQVKVTVPTTFAVERAGAKVKVEAVKRQKHTGNDGDIKFVAHRNLYIGFANGKVVVTKRTAEACAETLIREYGLKSRVVTG